MPGEQNIPSPARPAFDSAGARAVYYEIRDRGKLVWQENTANWPGAFEMGCKKLTELLAEPTYDNRFDFFKDGVLVGSALT